jgi:hypothetical protein
LIPNGLGGVRVTADGQLLFEPDVVDAAWRRMWNAVDTARSGGIPPVTAAGDVPAGVYDASWGEVTTRFAGPGRRRVDLTHQLGRALGKMHEAGVKQAVVGGSFVGMKAAPGDVDVAIIPPRDGSFLDVQALQQRIAPVAPDVHVYPGWMMVSNSHELPGATAGENFVELFQHARDGTRRGAVLIEPGAQRAGRLASRLLRR